MIQLRWDHRMSPNATWLRLYNKGKFGHREIHTERRQCHRENIIYKPRNTWSCQKRGERHGRKSLSQPSKRTNSAKPCFQTSSLQNCETANIYCPQKWKCPWSLLKLPTIICPTPFHPLSTQFQGVFYNPLIWINFSIPSTSMTSRLPIITTLHYPVL